jgi:hypothetical protein
MISVSVIVLRNDVWESRKYGDHISHLSKQDQHAVTEFLGTEGCQPVESHQQIQVMYGNASVSKTTLNDWTGADSFVSFNNHHKHQGAAHMTRGTGASGVQTSPLSL